MNEVLRFFEDYEMLLYFVLGLGAILYVWRFIVAWQEIQGSIYRLERESAQGRLKRAAMGLFTIILIGVGVFSLVTFVRPLVPVTELVEVPTALPSPDAEASLTAEAPVEEGELAVLTATPLPTVAVLPNGCQPDAVEITSPVADSAISGEVEVTGTVDITNFGFYKFEVAPTDEELWLTIQAGRNIVRDDVLVENWDTSLLPPGDYVLQLVVTDSSGQELTPCRIPVEIGATQ